MRTIGQTTDDLQENTLDMVDDRNLLANLLEEIRGTDTKQSFRKQCGIGHHTYYQILKGRSPRISTLDKISKGASVDRRTLILTAYCGGEQRPIGIHHPRALRSLLKSHPQYTRISTELIYRPGHLKILKSLESIAASELKWKGKPIDRTALILAAYCSELPG